MLADNPGDLFGAFTDGDPADGVPGEVDPADVLRRPRPLFQVGPPLHDAEESLLIRACMRGLAALQPADRSLVRLAQACGVVVGFLLPVAPDGSGQARIDACGFIA